MLSRGAALHWLLLASCSDGSALPPASTAASTAGGASVKRVAGYALLPAKTRGARHFSEMSQGRTQEKRCGP